jgi:hypothetical protein
MRESVELTRLVEVEPAFDKRHANPHKNYGVHGADLAMILKGPTGAVRWLLFTNLHKPNVVAEWVNELTAKGVPLTDAGLLLTLTDERVTTENVFYALKRQRAILGSVSLGWPESVWFEPSGADLGYHSPVPLRDDQRGTEPRPGCPYLDGRPCWNDGSATAGGELLEAFQACGPDGIWRHLEWYYRETFAET